LLILFTKYIMIELLGGPVREGVLPGCDGRILVMLLF